MQKDGTDISIVFTCRFVDGTKYGLSVGEKHGCIREFCDFDSVEEIETLMFGLADMLNKIKIEHNGKLPRW